VPALPANGETIVAVLAGVAGDRSEKRRIEVRGCARIAVPTARRPVNESDALCALARDAAIGRRHQSFDATTMDAMQCVAIAFTLTDRDHSIGDRGVGGQSSRKPCR
jgi:hypothetical protein